MKGGRSLYRPQDFGTARSLLPAPLSHGSVLKKDKDKIRDRVSTGEPGTTPDRLQELLEQGRRLRQQIETIAADVDFPLTRDSDGDPRLRANPAIPDLLHDRARKRRAEKRR